MKKLFIIIIILAVIFVGMIIYKNVTNNSNNISIEEINNIQEYISKIYMWKEITGEALPKFDDINNANELWIWEATKKDLEETELTYDQIKSKKEEIFGKSLKKDFPVERK